MDNVSSPQHVSPTSRSGVSAATRSKAVFLDRDGTIIHDAHYLSDPDAVKLLPNAAPALAMLRNSGYLLFLFTNQSGIGRGLFSIDAVHRCNQRMIDLLGLGASVFTDICIAPESPDETPVYRKPSPRFILESMAKHSIDPSQAWMVGDKAIDVEAGRNAGINAALISNKPRAEAKDSNRYESLHAFAQALCLRPA